MIALTGCSAAAPSYDGHACERDSSDALATKVQVTGAAGAAKVDVTSPVRTAQLSYADVIAGEGEPITSPDQFAILNRTLVHGVTGEQIHQGISFWSPDSASEEFAGVGDALACATDGSRVVVAIPASTLPEGAPQQLGLSGSDSLIAVYDVRAIMLTKAQGDAVFNDASGLPTVVRTDEGRPGIIIPDADAPNKTVTQTLIAGSGDKVGDSAAVIRSTSVGWQSRAVENTSWDGPVSDVSGLPEEAQAAVKKATVGSQLMVVLPGEGGDATTYVIDVLGVIPKELTQG